MHDDGRPVSDALDQLQKEKGLDIPIHVDGASGGFLAPFCAPDLEWDFRLPRVKSINTSGHKFGLVYPGIGWVIFREKSIFNEDLIFYVNYLGGESATATLNPGQDNTLAEELPDNSSGACDSIFSGLTDNGAGTARRALLQFDIAAAIPPGSIINNEPASASRMRTALCVINSNNRSESCNTVASCVLISFSAVSCRARTSVSWNRRASRSTMGPPLARAAKAMSASLLPPAWSS